MINDYKKWYSGKEDFLNHLFHHDSIIFYRLHNIINVLNFIRELPEEELNDDYDVIFDTGFSFLFTTINEIEMYLTKYFNNNLHAFLNYEVLINYSLYLNDLKNVLQEQESYTEQTNLVFNDVLEKIEMIISKKNKFDINIVDEFDQMIMGSFIYSKEHITTSEVFDRIAEELQLE